MVPCGRTSRRASRRRLGSTRRSRNRCRARKIGSRNRVSGGIAIREWLESINESSVVPERGQPTTKIGRSEAIGEQATQPDRSQTRRAVLRRPAADLQR